MPAVKIYTETMDSSKKQKIAEQFCEIIKKCLEVPIAEIIFLDMDKIYGTDQSNSDKYCLLEIFGPEKSPKIIESLGKSLCNSFIIENKELDYHVSAVYQPINPHYVIEENGSLYNLMKQKKLHKGE